MIGFKLFRTEQERKDAETNYEQWVRQEEIFLAIRHGLYDNPYFTDSYLKKRVMECLPASDRYSTQVGLNDDFDELWEAVQYEIGERKKTRTAKDEPEPESTESSFII